MNILVVNPMAPDGHVKFDQEIIRSLRGIGTVTLAAPPGYLEDCEVDTRKHIDVPNIHTTSKIGARWSQIKALGYVLKNFRPESYDAVVFLAYELISFAVRWPTRIPVLLFEHNNIDEVSRSRIKKFVFKRFVNNNRHVAYEQYIADYLSKQLGKESFHVPHPVTIDVSGSSDGVLVDWKMETANDQRPAPLKIFSPSWRTPVAVQRELAELAKSSPNEFHAVIRGQDFEITANYEVRPYFEDFENSMRDADICLIGGRYDYRVSAIAYQALSINKTILMFDSPFARELLAQYPEQVFVINSTSDIPDMRSELNRVANSSKSFLYAHSPRTIKMSLENALSDFKWG